MAINTTFILVFGIFCYLVLPLLVYFLVKNQQAKKIVLIVLFCLYLCVLAVGVFGKIDITSKFVTISFDFSAGWANKPINFSFDHLTKFDIVINLFMLIPVGIFIVMLSKNAKWWQILLKTALFGLITGVSIETLQFILPVARSVQLSDAIFNCASAIIGGIYALPFCRIKKQ